MRISTKELLTQHWLLLLTGFLLVFFSAFGQTVFIGAHIPFIQDTFGLSHTELSLYYSAATLCSGLLLFYTGKFLDTVALRIVVAVALVGLAIGTFILAFTPVPYLLFPAFFLLRQCGQGLMPLINTVSMNRYLEKARGRASAISGFGQPLMMIFPIIGLLVVREFGWQNAWALYGAFILIFLLPLFYFLFRHHDHTIHNEWKEAMERSAVDMPDNPIKQWTRLEVLKDWRFYIIVCVLIIDPCFNTTIFYYQGEVAASKGLPPEAIVTALPLFTIASVSMMYLAGDILDRFGEKYILFAYPLIYIAALLILASPGGIPTLYTGLIVQGLAAGCMSVLGGPILAKLYGTKNLGSIKSALGSIFIMSSAVGPLIAGICLDHDIGMKVILSGFAVYAFLAWAVMASFLRGKLD